MADTLTQIDAVAELATWTRGLGGMYAKDLKATPQETYTKPNGGVSRTVQEFTAEAAGMCHLVAALLSGATPTGSYDEQSAALLASIPTSEAAAEAVIAAANNLADAILANADKLPEMTTAPWGDTLTFFSFSTIAANHLWYHDGQLNLLQAQNGDGAVHWMDQ